MVTGVHAVPGGGTGGGAAGPGGRGGVRAGSPGELPHRPGHGRLHPGHRLHRGRYPHQGREVLRTVHVVSISSYSNGFRLGREEKRGSGYVN